MYSFVPEAAVIAVGVTIPPLAIHAGETHSSIQDPHRENTAFEALYKTLVCGLEGQEGVFVGSMQDHEFHPGW